MSLVFGIHRDTDRHKGGRKRGSFRMGNPGSQLAGAKPGKGKRNGRKCLIRKFIQLGVTAGVVTSIDEVVKIIEELK